MKYFLSDTHFGDPRLNLYNRELIASSPEEVDNLIISNYNKLVADSDTVYFLGDIAYNPEKISLINNLKGYKILIKGNYDDKIDDSILKTYFNEVYSENLIIEIGGEKFHLNHYPSKCVDTMANLTGHIHGLWKVQRNMINVGVDAWHMMPINEEMITFVYNAIRKYYDENVFAGELNANLNLKY